MDRPLTQLLAESAKDLLAISLRFEPFHPQSIQNSIQALHFLGGLASLTQTSLESKKVTLEPAPAQPALTGPTKKEKSAAKDKSLLEALLQARKANPSFRRTPGIFSPILRSNPS